jgi:16S rRNA (uracil1498-N3)-methyltransferase
MHRFYCPRVNFSSPVIDIRDKNEIHHIRDVLRLKEGDPVTVFNQAGEEAMGEIRECSSCRVSVEIHKVSKVEKQAPEIVLACAIPKKSKFEFIIEKATELGVDEIIPLKTQRAEMNLKGERLSAKCARYRSVAVNAAKQSGRSYVPILHPVMDFSSAIKFLIGNSVVFIPSLEGDRTPVFAALARQPSPAKAAFFIGPEGDFTPEEYAEARANGCIPVSLGPHILKVDTAAVVAVACASLYYRHA